MLNKFNNDGLVLDFFKEFKDEDLIWIAYDWCYEHLDMKENQFLSFLNNHQDFRSILDFITLSLSRSSQETCTHFIKKWQMNSTLMIPRHQLKFLSNDHRLCWFIINVLCGKNAILDIVQPSDVIITNPYLLVVFYIYTSKIDERITIEEITNYRDTMYQTLNPTKLLNKYVDDEYFSKWALDYTKKNFRWNVKPRNFNPSSSREARELFLIFWDYYYYQNPDKYILNIQKLKKAWQQKQFRDKGGLKKPYHLPLTKKTKSQLVALAEKMNISETKILEKLIEEAYQKEMLDAKGKALY